MMQKELRAGSRLPVNQRGSLNDGNGWSPCLIVDMSNTGILLMSTREFSVGQSLKFSSELFPGKFLECALQVVHTDDTRLGTKMLDLDASSRKLVQAYLEEQYAHRLDTLSQDRVGAR